MDGSNKEYADNVKMFMSDLNPSDLITVEVPPREEQTFYIKPTKAPSKIKISLTVTSPGEFFIDFKVNLISF